MCAVDLIKGIGICAGCEVIPVPGATGNYYTNYLGKGEAAIEAFRRGRDLVYVHVEAPDECGHQGNPLEKTSAIEKIDAEILSPVYQYLLDSGEDFRILCLPDHPTPCEKRTHTSDPVPYFLYDSRTEKAGCTFTEANCAAMGDYNPAGHTLLSEMIEK